MEMASSGALRSPSTLQSQFTPQPQLTRPSQVTTGGGFMQRYWMLMVSVFFLSVAIVLGAVIWYTLASGYCKIDTDCSSSSSGGICNTSINKCVNCLTTEDCHSNADTCDGSTGNCSCGSGPVCDVTGSEPVCLLGRCVQCQASSDCPLAKPHCDIPTHTCYGCAAGSTDSYQCPPGYVCADPSDQTGDCVIAPCSTDSDCPPGKTCDSKSGTCSGGADTFSYAGDSAQSDIAANKSPAATKLLQTSSTSGPTECANGCVAAGSACSAFTWVPETAGGATGTCYLFSTSTEDPVTADPLVGAWFGRALNSRLAASCPIGDLPCGTYPPQEAQVYPGVALPSAEADQVHADVDSIQTCITKCAFTDCGDTAKYAFVDSQSNCSCYEDGAGVTLDSSKTAGSSTGVVQCSQ